MLLGIWTLIGHTTWRDVMNLSFFHGESWALQTNKMLHPGYTGMAEELRSFWRWGESWGDSQQTHDKALVCILSFRYLWMTSKEQQESSTRHLCILSFFILLVWVWTEYKGNRSLIVDNGKSITDKIVTSLSNRFDNILSVLLNPWVLPLTSW